MYLPPPGSIGVALWAGAPNHPGGGVFLEVVPIKRFVSLLLAFALAVGLAFDLAPRGKAVAPVALVEAALVSYVASTGYKLWVDNGTGSDVLSFMSKLYSDWLFSLSGGTLTLEQIGSQGYVYTDNSGHICITKTAADIFQDFSDWIQTEYSVPLGSDSPTTVVSSGPGFALGGQWLIVNTVPSGSSVSTFDFVGTYSVSDFDEPLTYRGTSYLVSYLDDFSGYWIGYNVSVSPTLYVYVGGTYPIGRFALGTSPSSLDVSQIAIGYNKNYANSPALRFFAYSVSGSDWVTSSGAGWEVPSEITVSSGLLGTLGVTLAQNVIDKATDLAQDYVLVFDVGAAAGATATDIADAVVAGYDATTGAVPVTDTITAADVIDTPVQPYPDVDSLGLPQLGLALTTRFPFSIPWDISAIYSAISAPSEPPVKTFDLIPASVLARWGISANTSITIDLTDQKYDVLLAIIHWSCIIGFCFGLAVMTKRYVWTTGG